MYFEASTAKEKSFYYRTFEQEAERVFERINEYCKLGRYSGMMSVQTKHVEELEDLLKNLGYDIKIKPLVNITDVKQTIKISWEG